MSFISFIVAFILSNTLGQKNKINQLKQRAGSAEIPVREDKRGNKRPEEERETQPAGAHLHPHSWHTALHGMGGGVWSGVGHKQKGTI